MTRAGVQNTLILRDADVRGMLSMEEAISISENAFMQKSPRRTQMPHKLYLKLSPHNGDLKVVPAWMEAPESAGVKIVSVYPDNPRMRGLPTVIATVMLFDPDSGLPICIMDGTWLTSLRTGAAGGLAARCL